MSYYANSTGALFRLKKGPSVNDMVSRFVDAFNLDEVSITEKPNYLELSFVYPYGEFDEVEFMEGLNKLNECMISGCVSFAGEDRKTMFDSLFRYVFDSEKQGWFSENAVETWPSDAKLQISHSDRQELIGVFVDIVEDFLDEKKIDIPNPEKDQDECAAIIYGSDYDRLASEFEKTLIVNGILKKEDRYDV